MPAGIRSITKCPEACCQFQSQWSEWGACCRLIELHGWFCTPDPKLLASATNIKRLLLSAECKDSDPNILMLILPYVWALSLWSAVGPSWSPVCALQDTLWRRGRAARNARSATVTEKLLKIFKPPPLKIGYAHVTHNMERNNPFFSSVFCQHSQFGYI